MMLSILKILDPFWRGIDLETNQTYKAYWKGIRGLALYYACQLAIYRLLGGVSELASFNARFSQIAGTILGAGVGICWLWHYRTIGRKNTIRRILQVSAIVMLAGIGLLCLLKLGRLVNDYWYLGVSGLFGAGWACGIGAAIVWCTEVLPPELRTSGTCYITASGFAGALLASGILLVKFLPGLVIWICLIIGGGLLYVSWRELPQDSRLNAAFTKQENRETNIIKYLMSQRVDRKYLLAVVTSLLLGINVQFAAVLMQNWQEFTPLNERHIEPSDFFELLQLIRYAFAVVACILVLKWSWQESIFGKSNPAFRKRITPLARLQFVQFILICFLLWVFLFNFEWFHNRVLVVVTSVFLGLLAAIWVLSLLAIAEQFSLRDRIVWLILAPTAYRVLVDGILLFRIDKEHWLVDCSFSGQESYAVLLWGCVFAFVAWLVTLGIEDNFEGDPLLNIKKHEKLSTATIRDSIMEEKPKSPGKINDFLKTANEKLISHLQEVLQAHLYYGSVYYRPTRQQVYASLPIESNMLAFEAYGHPQFKLTAEDYFHPHDLVTDLVKQNKMASLVAQINDKKSDGALITFSARKNALKGQAPEGYQIIDLHQEADLSDTELNAALNYLGKPYKTDKDKEEVQAYFCKVATTPEARLFHLLRADCERYVHGRYYLYIIRPYASESKVSLVLKTAVALRENRLEELRSLISFVDTKVVKEHDYEATITSLFAQQEHDRAAELGWLKDKAEALSDPMDCPEEFITEPFAVLRTELQHITSYLHQTARVNVAMERYRNNPQKFLERFPESTFNISELIRDTWKVVSQSISFLRLNQNGHDRKLLAFFEQQKDHQFAQFDINSVPLIFRMVLFELIKNAAEQSDPEQVDLRVSIDPTAGRVSIANTVSSKRAEVLKKQLGQWSLDMTDTDERMGSGLRSVKRKLRFVNQLNTETTVSLSATLATGGQQDFFYVQLDFKNNNQ